MLAIEHSPGPSAPRWLFVLELTYLLALLGAAVLYSNWDGLQDAVSNQLGPVPIAVPWWGAVGGATISLTGIFRNSTSWSNSYERWHVARPVLGATVGTVGYLMFVVVLRTTGAEPQANNLASSATADVVAFLVGYREDLFRDLLKTATTFLFKGRSTSSESAAADSEQPPLTRDAEL